MLRVADADLLPLQFADLAVVYENYVKSLHKLVDDKRDHARKLDLLLADQVFELSADPTRRVGPPAAESDVPYLDFAPLDNAIERLKHSTKAYDEAYRRAAGKDLGLDSAQRAKLDQLLQGLEQALTSNDGLPERPWYKHLIYAPGRFTGYAAKTMPAVREAIEARNWDEASQYIGVTAHALEGYCQQLNAAAALLGAGGTR